MIRPNFRGGRKIAGGRRERRFIGSRMRSRGPRRFTQHGAPGRPSGFPEVRWRKGESRQHGPVTVGLLQQVESLAGVKGGGETQAGRRAGQGRFSMDAAMNASAVAGGAATRWQGGIKGSASGGKRCGGYCHGHGHHFGQPAAAGSGQTGCSAVRRGGGRGHAAGRARIGGGAARFSVRLWRKGRPSEGNPD